MINMKIKDYLIKSDENNVTVEKMLRDENMEVKVNKNNEPSTTLVGYFPSLEHALKGIQKNYVYGKGTDVQTIKDYREALNEITNEFHSVLKL